MRSSTRPVCLLLGAFVLAAGCECSVDVGARDTGQRDAGTFRPRTDECGNGIDDDRNGRIDDGCVCGQGDVQSCFSGDYPGHGIGACRDGVQTCAVQEFGDWGMFSCTGETLPSPEICDDIDNDCDGARDEDCPCEAGATRMCSDEFAIAPCMPGTQTCRAGTWSRCEGAVGPTADVCGDAIDNDCDGLTNEGCTCVSSPEQCNDRIDNDCDGDVDEVTCAPLPDAGMSVDAGVDAATAVDAACSGTLCDVAPRPIAPLSTSTVTSRRPTLRWENPPGVTSARVELCRDRACTMSLGTLDGTNSARPASDLPTGWVFWRVLRASSVSPTWQFWVGARSADGDRDTSWGTVLDMDGDGASEMWLSHKNYMGSGPRLDFFEGLPVTPRSSLSHTSPNAYFPIVVPAGDLNGDGFGDLAFDVNGMEVQIFFGGAAAMATEPNQRIAAVGLVSLTGLGDVNGDGYGDFAAGGTGAVSVFHGSATGLSSTPTSTWSTPPCGGGFGCWVVERVRAAGDLNADGFADLVETANGRTLVRVHLGGPTGLAATPVLEANDTTNTRTFSLSGSPGDTNGDGFADIVYGRPDWGTTVRSPGPGDVEILLGGVDGVSASRTQRILDSDSMFGDAIECPGDVNGDGYDEFLINDATEIRLFTSRASGLQVSTWFATCNSIFGGPPTCSRGLIQRTGSLDGDLLADFAIGNPTGASPQLNVVNVYVGTSGLASNPPTLVLRASDTGDSVGTAGF